MSRKFKLHKRYYGEDYDLYKKGTITINEGVTVLVGCNGSGKTTLLHQIKDTLKKDNIPFLSFDNLHDGGSRAISSAGYHGDFGFMANAMTSSEGENIALNFSKLAPQIRNFLKTGKTNSEKERLMNAFAEIIKKEDNKEEQISNERWFLFDAVDSGFSVDNIVDLKEYVFKPIIENNSEYQIYIIISANEYELCRGENCFDVYNGKYKKFSSYERYRNFILKSREIKDQRYNDSVNKN